MGVGLGLLDLLAHVRGAFGQAPVPVGDRLLDGRLSGFLRGGDRFRGRSTDFLQLSAGSGLGLFGRGLAGCQLLGGLGPDPVQPGERLLSGVIGLGLGLERGRSFLSGGAGGALRRLRSLRLSDGDQDGDDDGEYGGLLSRPVACCACSCSASRFPDSLQVVNSCCVCRLRYSSWTSMGVRCPSPEWRRLAL